MIMHPFPCEKTKWKIYGNYKTICCGTIFVHPLRPWWWALEFYTIFVICIFAAEFAKFAAWQTAIGVTIGVVCLFSSFKTILSNPGICPRPSYDEAVSNAILPTTEKQRLSMMGNQWTILIATDDPWYDCMTFCCALLGFSGLLILPPIMSCCKCWDKVHSRNAWGSRWMQSPTASSNATYPRQPPTEDITKYGSAITRQNEDISNRNDTETAINFAAY
ncbi:hypothetical protein Fcan01_02180 [Folsomia candida]|uniref:Uncharacterized protein n=1 Tax=Folsomia candida TaxID=158441 RepID=A0A226F2L7_FOLCA|nr:hypothetical protein Fcan01_02180 [Folsomia candida]